MANTSRVLTAALVLVVVFAVSRVSAPLVQIVDMIPVRDGHMSAAVTVDMVMVLMHRVAGRFAFVVVIVMPSMKVTVVHIVHMVTVRDRDVPAAFTVDVIMIAVLAVSCTGHRFAPLFRPNFDS
ncbi:MAG: hypothetical protein JOZ23_01740 [Mycobacterium sp.]|nr:hypothetical protein [Mycobacterium sp.]